MTFPTPGTPVETQLSVNGTSHVCSLPATVNAGDLLVLHIGLDGTTVTVTGPAGWTLKWTTQGMGCWVKKADGTEGGGTATVTSSASEAGAAQCIRVTGWFGDLSGVEAGTTATGSSANPDCPSLTPSWGAADTLWMALVGARDDDATVSSYPASYSGGTDTVSGIGVANEGAEVGYAYRQNNTATENPGTFTLSESESWIANTLAIRPAAISRQVYHQRHHNRAL